MFRSSSFAALDRKRVCCKPRASSPRRVARRMHDEHCGRSEDLGMDAIACVLLADW